MIESVVPSKVITYQQWQHVVAALISHNKTIVLLDSPESEGCHWSLIGWGRRQHVTVFDKTLQWESHTLEEPVFVKKNIDCSETVWGVLEQARQKCRIYWDDQPSLPFHGGLAGLLHYEAADLCDGALTRAKTNDEPSPKLEFVECNNWALWDHSTGEVFISNHDPVFYDDAEQPEKHIRLPSLAQPWQASLSQDAFEAHANTLLHAIQQGECYQANLSIQWKSQLTGDLWPIYQALTEKNPSPFAGFWQTNNQTVVCNSPERLVSIENRWEEQSSLPEQWATTRPIAGTRGRGNTDLEDTAIGESLRSDAKEQAEHLMLVDLLRNDLGKIAIAGSVTVRELMVLERYAHVTHLVSDIEGQLLPRRTPWQVLQAVFPGGTITGCPKIRSVQWLNRCEPLPRGPYTGSMGYVDALTGSMDWNIIIRSLYATQAADANPTKGFPHWDVAFHAGAGIVADSIPAYEYRECLRKAHSIFSLWE
ncbi:MAG: anthranilate synthase component I family protein [Vampirovibrionales bacterium]|nr:anthranilate synthase component I family protein [Vampirovibrionales bacterium]